MFPFDRGENFMFDILEHFMFDILEHPLEKYYVIVIKLSAYRVNSAIQAGSTLTT